MLRTVLYVAGGVALAHIMFPDALKRLQYAAGEYAARAAIKAARSPKDPNAVPLDADQLTAEVLAAPFAQGALHELAAQSGNAFLQQFVTDLVTPAPAAG